MVSERQIARSRIAREPMLGREIGSVTPNAIRLFLAETATQIDSRATDFSSNETIKQAVMAELAIALISAHPIAMEVELGRLVILDVAGAPMRRQRFLVNRVDRAASPTAAASESFMTDRGRDFLPKVEDTRSSIFW